MKKICVIIIAAVLAISVNSRSETKSAREIVREAEHSVRGKTMVSLTTIKIKTRRWTRTLKMKSYESRVEDRSFAEILKPKKDAGNRFLLIGDTMRHYVPKLQKVIKISPSMMLQSWMGSDFTNDDIVQMSSIVEDYTHHLEGKQKVDGHTCHRIVLRPKPDAAVVWGKIIYYARVKDSLPVRNEFYNQHDVLKKRLTFRDFRVMDGRLIPTEYKMKTIRKEDRYTLMIINRVNFNVDLPDYIFTLQHLKRG